jgi:DNA-directed RNA polymerase subunit K/omega
MSENTTPMAPELGNETNRYLMVHKVARRAKQIMEGHAQTAAEISNNRAIRNAIKELSATTVE